MSQPSLEAGLGAPKPKSRKRTYIYAGLAFIFLIVVGVAVGVAVSQVSSVRTLCAGLFAFWKCSMNMLS